MNANIQFGDPRLPKQFWDRICVSGECWEWTGCTVDGYGQVTIQIHRLAYLLLVGDIPSGHVLDHKECANPACMRPLHIEPVTRKENTRRAYTPEAIAKRRSRRLRTHRLVFRCSKRERELMERAAARRGTTFTGFVREAMLSGAEAVLLEPRPTR